MMTSPERRAIEQKIIAKCDLIHQALVKEILLDALKGYTGRAVNGYSYLTVSPDEQWFTVITAGIMPHKRFVNTGLIVRLVDDIIVIEQDLNDKILLDVLLEAGIPRHQIILAYAGELVPEKMQV